MTKLVRPVSRRRHVALTAGTGVIALVTAVFLAGVPPLAASAGAVLAVSWLIWRGPGA